MPACADRPVYAGCCISAGGFSIAAPARKATRIASEQRPLARRYGTPDGCGRELVRRSAGPRGAAVLDRSACGKLDANPHAQAPVSQPCSARAPERFPTCVPSAPIRIWSRRWSEGRCIGFRLDRGNCLAARGVDMRIAELDALRLRCRERRLGATCG